MAETICGIDLDASFFFKFSSFCYFRKLFIVERTHYSKSEFSCIFQAMKIKCKVLEETNSETEKFFKYCVFVRFWAIKY